MRWGCPIRLNFSAMRSVWFVLFAAGMAFSACEKLDLKRDNPLDENNPDYITTSDDQNGKEEPNDGEIVEGVAIRYSSYKVRSDGNGDGAINKGERVEIDVSLKNVGTVTAKGVEAVFSTTSEYVSGFGPMATVAYGDIQAGYAKWSRGNSSSYYTAFEFSVSEETPSGTKIPVKIEMEDVYGNKWEDSLTLTVESTRARIGYSGYKVRSDGNGDGAINKGERVEIDVSLKNVGTVTAKGVEAVFSTTSEYVSGFGPMATVAYGDIQAGYAKWSRGNSSSYYTAFEFSVSEETPSGTKIPIKIEIEDVYGNKWESELMLEVY